MWVAVFTKKYSIHNIWSLTLFRFLLQVCHEYVAEQGIELYELVRVNHKSSFLYGLLLLHIIWHSLFLSLSLSLYLRWLICQTRPITIWLLLYLYLRRTHDTEFAGIHKWTRRIIHSIVSAVYLYSSQPVIYITYIYMPTCIICTYDDLSFFLCISPLTLISYSQLWICEVAHTVQPNNEPWWFLLHKLCLI